ncbi:MAG TPA: tryptophan--tRNA ligase [Desulfobacteraceae bacterium]|nr:tryptophan--tRNA ligase [Desulfobacteraceae bacterium]
MTKKKRILSGMRPTGPLHLGNLHGALANWITMQNEYDCFFFIADWHALTSDYENTDSIGKNIDNMMIDWLSAGLSPDLCTMFVQSQVKEHSELFLLLSMITPVPWLERNPTYKDQIVQMGNKDLSTFGFLGYPVLQTADIILYKGDSVPVGVDQVPHIEIAREIVRRFNYLFDDVFPEPEAILTESPKILGTDRRKMSKSYNNAIYLSDTPDEVMAKVSKMITDSQRGRKSDPGDPDICNVFEFHKLYSNSGTVEQLSKECRTAEIGCVECKKIMGKSLLKFLEPIHGKRKDYESRPDFIADIVAAGCSKAREIAQQTMEEVRAAVKI